VWWMTWTAISARLYTPEHHLQLDFVYGYRAHDSRHNLVYNVDGLITYPAAATGIAYDSREHTQQFFTMHTVGWCKFNAVEIRVESAKASALQTQLPVDTSIESAWSSA